MLRSILRPVAIPTHGARTTSVTGLRAPLRTNYARQLHLPTKTVTDDDIAQLAASPLHPLTLADLVKY